MMVGCGGGIVDGAAEDGAGTAVGLRFLGVVIGATGVDTISRVFRISTSEIRQWL